MTMREVCKKCKESPLVKSPKAGARHVYCVKCDRETARERMRKRRAKKYAEQIERAYYIPTHGFVYIVYNPSYHGWVKVGCALDAENRLRSFQTATPYRNFVLKWAMFTDNKLQKEQEAHELLERYCERKGEWFKIQPYKAIRILRRLWK